MSMRTFLMTLMASTALSTIAMTGAVAQTAQPADTKPATPAVPAPAAAPATAAPAATAAPVAPVAKPAAAAPAPKPAPTAAATPAPKPVDVGTVYAKEAEKPAPALVQTGLTASPTDFAVAQDKARAAAAATGAPGAATGAATATGTARPVGIGGSTGQDVGGGYMINEEAKKSRSTVTRDAIDKQSPTSNPYQLINLLPGVVQSSVDNTGANGGNIRVRGFNSDHLGFTIEGAPINDSGNFALFPQEYVDAENIGQISISPGTGEIDSPHIGATGGVINLYAIDPPKEKGVLVDYSFGSNALNREFVRISSGQIGAVRAFLSFSNLEKDHWGGHYGSDDRQHLDFKIAADLSPGNTVRLSAIYNKAINTFYPAPTLAQFNAKSDIKYSLVPFNTNNFQYRINPFKNLILSAPSNFTISENIKFDTIPYYWYGYGNGGGVAAPSNVGAGGAANGFGWGNVRVTGFGDKAYYNPSITKTDRPGVINKFTVTTGNHQIVAGHWFEYAKHRQYGAYSKLNADGSVADPFGDSNVISPAGGGYTCFAGTTATQVACPAGPINKRDVVTTTTTNAVFIGDSWKFAPGFTLDYGIKQVFVTRETRDFMPGSPVPQNSLEDQATLPQAALSYKWQDGNQVFASVGTSFRTANNFTLTPNYANNTTRIPGVVTPKAEEGIVYELGHRFQGPAFNTSITGFLGRYENFQQNARIEDPNNPGSFISSNINVGGLMNYGVDAEFGTRPINNFRPYISAGWLHTEMLDNLPVVATNGRADFLNTKGRTLVGAPNYTIGLGLDYDNGHLFANAGYKIIGEQYSSFMNDEKIGAFGRLDMSVGYRFDDIAQLKQPEVRLQLFNVLNSRDLTGVNSFQNNTKATTGVNGNAIAASGTSSYYQGQDFSFMVTLRAGL